MMMRRYADAIRTFTNILLYVQRTKTMFQTKSYQNDQINKQTDQMFVLLAICLVLHPQRIDESLLTTLREKNYAEKMNKMQRGELAEFETCFTFSCPKFLSPVPPAYESANSDEKYKVSYSFREGLFYNGFICRSLLNCSSRCSWKRFSSN